MANASIEVIGASKQYRLGTTSGYRTLREAISVAATRLTHARAIEPTAVWALRDVDFEITQGEAVGVIGRNGAGKTTLLKLLARITSPTEGVVRTFGRVGALLEVGVGFHPELTGRENAYLYGTVLGMRKSDIDHHLDSIVAFADVERALDTPVKRYSTGMRLRLAFAVAAHLGSEILVVDEVLAVGDAEFQRRCLGTMESAERAGRTVVFVSHDLDAVSRLCPRALWLDGGKIAADGATNEVATKYLASVGQQRTHRQFQDDPGCPVRLVRVDVFDAAGRPAEILRRDQPLSIEVTFDVREPVKGLDVALYVESVRGVRIFDEVLSDTNSARPETPGHYSARLQVPPVLNIGDFEVGVWFGTPYGDVLEESATVRFTLEGSNKDRPARAVELLLPWELREVRHD